MSRLGHDLGDQAHAEVGLGWKPLADGLDGGGGVLLLVLAHLLENGAGFVVACRELARMLVQVLADLIFSSSDEAQADAIADQTGRGADPERQPVEKRIEHAGAAAQLADALFTPGQMVDFLIRRLFHRPTYLREASRQGLALVRSEEHTSELQSLMRISYAVFCLK